MLLHAFHLFTSLHLYPLTRNSGVDATKRPPKIVQWLKKLSPFASAIEALCLGEYPGMSFRESKNRFSRLKDLPKMGGLALVENGDQVIEALGLAQQTYGAAMKHLGLLSGGYLVLSWIGLAMQCWYPKMQRALANDKKMRRRRQKPSLSPTEGISSTPSKPIHPVKAIVPNYGL